MTRMEAVSVLSIMLSWLLGRPTRREQQERLWAEP